MIYLFENATGFTLFTKQDDKLQIVDTYKFANNNEIVETYKSMESKELPCNLEKFIKNTFKDLSDILAVRDNKLAELITEKCSVSAKYVCDDIFREIRDELNTYCNKTELSKTLFLSHKMGLEKIKFNTEKLDTMVIQSINLLLDIDKDINLHCMRIREWYGLHFPELSLLIDDNELYIKLVTRIQNKNKAGLKQIEDIADDKAVKIIELARNSMGTELTDEDIKNIVNDCESVMKNFEYRNNLATYIKKKMEIVAPNITNLVGDYMGARLMSKAGSLSTLAKYPASTIQLLGSEKSLFQALRNNSNTPKYGIIFESSILGQVQPEYKGKIARSLASKISLCAKIDCLGKNQDGKFGAECRDKIFNRIKSLEGSQKIKKKIQTKSKFSVTQKEKYNENEDVKRMKKQ